MKYATDSILEANNIRNVVFPFFLFFLAMMLGGNTGNLNNLLNTLFTKNAVKIFSKRFMKRSYDEKQDSFYNCEFYNEYTFVKNNINSTYQIAITVVSRLLSALASLIITIVAFSFLSPIMVIVILFLSIVTVLINHLSVNKRVELDSKYVNLERRAEYFEKLLSDRAHAKELRIFKLQNFLLKKWNEVFKKISKAHYDFECRTNMLMSIPVVIEELISALMIVFFLYRTLNARLSVGDFVLMFRMMWRVSSAISIVVNILSSDILQNYKYIERYDKFITSSSKVDDLHTLSTLGNDFKSLELKGVSYSYPAQKGYAVDNVNFSIQKGEVVSILGYNGSGKSTLSKIMCGLLEDYEGQVLINGQDITSINRDKRYSMFGIAFQDFTRYSLSLKDNISIGMIDKQDNESAIKQAIDKGNLSELIDSLPDGIDTILGKEFDSSGQDLSGGQWQRIILSRAYMGNPPILILDEPTASIDPIQEMKMLDDFREMIEGQTAILISHRIGFARLSDRIYIMDKGRIVEQGTHEELLDKGGVYKELYDSQKHLYDDGEGVIPWENQRIAE